MKLPNRIGLLQGVEDGGGGERHRTQGGYRHEEGDGGAVGERRGRPVQHAELQLRLVPHLSIVFGYS